MTFSLSPTGLKQMLSAHSSLALCCGIFLYLICFTGSLAVLAEEFERWQQPHIPEQLHYDPTTFSVAIDQFLQQTTSIPDSIYVVLPKEAVPRLHISAEGQEWWLDSHGHLVEQVAEGWIGLVKDLHIYLHLPESVGIFLVSALAVMLLALTISGVLAHPKMVKQAFLLRRGGSQRTQQVDLHNRLSVWGLPFYLMIGLTGAMYGLLSLIFWIAGQAFFAGSDEATIDHIYGADPVLNAEPVPLGIERAFTELAIYAPDAKPIYVVAHKLGQRQQFMEIGATLPGRLAYSEIYRFDAEGRILGHQGLTDGPIGRQWLYSIYRIHFGRFAGLWGKLVYVLLGLSLTIIVVSGINVWLLRRQRPTWMSRTWCGMVWGVPLSLAVAAAFYIIANVSATLGFVLGLLISLGLSHFIDEVADLRALLQRLTAFSLLVLLLGYGLKYPQLLTEMHILALNSGLFLTAVWLLYASRRQCWRLAVEVA